MGDWYVIANVPAFIEKDAWNSLEQYERRSEHVIDTTFSFNQGGSDGELKTYTPVGCVRDKGSNAEGGMQFIWPFKAEYIITHVDEDHTETVIGRTDRDYLWIMYRSPEMPEDRLRALIDLAVEEGCDREKIRIVPQENKQLGEGAPRYCSISSRTWMRWVSRRPSRKISSPSRSMTRPR